jgi:steroid 5-alpha reductase family enzyme
LNGDLARDGIRYGLADKPQTKSHRAPRRNPGRIGGRSWWRASSRFGRCGSGAISLREPAQPAMIRVIAIDRRMAVGCLRRMFWFLQTQAMVGVVLVISAVLEAQNGNPDLRIQDVLGIAILAAAISGEAIADQQLRRFKADPSKQGAVCDTGLWRWSRHPNYFFDWLGWLAYPLIALDSSGHNPYGWLALLGPACMYWALVHVSGIPPLEDHMLRSCGDVFRA